MSGQPSPRRGTPRRTTLFRTTRRRPVLRRAVLAAVLALTTLVATPATSGAANLAGMTLDTGTVVLGVAASGHVGIGPDGIGLLDKATGIDALPGFCGCEGWGIYGLDESDANAQPGSAEGAHTRAGQEDDDNSFVEAVNMDVRSFGAQGDAIVSEVLADGLFTVRHTFSVAPTTSRLVEVRVDVTNEHSSTLRPLYRRTLTWILDESLTSFSTVEGASRRNPLASNGSDIPNPRVVNRGNSGSVQAPFIDEGPDIHGAVFDLDLGELAPDASTSFSLFFGAAPSERAAKAALRGVGAEQWALGQPPTSAGASDGSPATWMMGLRDREFHLRPERDIVVVGEEIAAELSDPPSPNDTGERAIGFLDGTTTGTEQRLGCGLLAGLLPVPCVVRTPIWVVGTQDRHDIVELDVFIDRNDNGSADATEPRATKEITVVEPTKLVAIGDSFVSGDGAGDLLDDVCKRSGNAYPNQIRGIHRAVPLPTRAERVEGIELLNLGCTGATTVQMLRDGNGMGPGESIPPQLGNEAIPAGTNVFLIQAGGNDLGFSDVVKHCGVETDCHEVAARSLGGQTPEQHVTELLPVIQSRVTDLVRDAHAVRPEASILVMGYPHLVPPGSNQQACVAEQFEAWIKDSSGFALPGSIEASEQTWLRSATNRLNERLAAAATEAGAIFVDPRATFADRELCGVDEAWITPFGSQAPLHLTARGHQAMANLIDTARRKGIEEFGATKAWWPRSPITDDAAAAVGSLGEPRAADDDFPFFAQQSARSSQRADTERASATSPGAERHAIDVAISRSDLRAAPRTAGCASAGAAGSQMDLSALGFAAGTDVALTGRGVGEDPSAIATLTADDQGAIAATVTLPATGGPWYLRATGDGATSTTHHATALVLVSERPQPCDTIAPAAFIDQPTFDEETYVENQEAIVRFRCSDSGSELQCLATNDGDPLVDGDLLDTTLGRHDITVTATDAFGNRRSSTQHYIVGTQLAAVVSGHERGERARVDEFDGTVSIQFQREGLELPAATYDVVVRGGGAEGIRFPGTVRFERFDDRATIGISIDSDTLNWNRVLAVSLEPNGDAYRHPDLGWAEVTIVDDESNANLGDDRVLERIAGRSRTQTAAAVAATRHASGRGGAVVLARADAYPDALSGATLAAGLDAPILLTNRATLSADVAAEIERLGARTAWLLGGVGALSPTIEDQLRDLGVTRVFRLSGSDRFATAGAVAEAVFASRPASATRRVWIAEGANPNPRRGWPDALAAAPVAAFSGDPVLLVTRDVLPDATRAALLRDGVEEVLLAGGVGAVSDAVAQRIADLGIRVTRVSGTNRYATAVAIARRGLDDGMTPTTMWFATGASFPDALAAGGIVGAAGDLLVLVHPDDLDNSPATRDLVEELAPQVVTGRILGGTGAVGGRVAAGLTSALAGG